MDLTACQPIWVMLCRNELCQKLLKKYVNNIILFVEATVNMMKFKVCKGDLTNSYVLDTFIHIFYSLNQYVLFFSNKCTYCKTNAIYT